VPMLPSSTLKISDAPSFAWRGLMIDSGRRFFPVPLVENLLDTMAGAKMSVLHLHASDFCRFGVESKTYPNLTASLTGLQAGFYTQEDIANIIAYAGARGIRVVPEFDVPGHSRGFIPLISEGIQFCTSDSTQSQLYGDPKNQTFNILANLFTEMAGIFTDPVFHIGCDETSAVGPCTINSTFALERQILDYVQYSLGKTPAGWEEVLFDAGAATNQTIVDSWSRHDPSQPTSMGYNTIASNGSHFYFTSPAPGGPAGWSSCWYDIAATLTPSDMPKLLGGEMSMWSDTYCYIEQV
jgi:hexosaminidase